MCGLSLARYYSASEQSAVQYNPITLPMLTKMGEVKKRFRQNQARLITIIMIVKGLARKV
jgi:hypothetical protein